MTERARILLSSIGIMATVSLSTAVTAIYVLYQAGLAVHTARLMEVVESRARIIEAVAAFDARFSHDVFPEGATAATLSQIVAAHEKFAGFGKTGEFTLARLEGDQIVWLLRHRHQGVAMPGPTPLSSSLAEPMRRALTGEFGSVVGLDYRGVEVLAAHEKIQGVDWGAVAKIDMAEIRQPFARTGLMVSGVALFAIVIGVGFILGVASPLIRRIETRTDELRDAHQRLRLHSSEASLAVERERHRLAVDLHDGLGQLLALANIKLGLLRNTTEDAMLGPQIQKIEDIVQEACGLTKEVTFELSPPVLYELGLIPALHWLADEMERRYGLHVKVEEDGELAPLDEATRITLFRSLNELLINVAKHAKTDRALVQLSQRNGAIMIAVEDDGIGFHPSSDTDGYGLFSVRERLHHLGGVLKAESTRGKGTRMVLIAPLKAAGSETSIEST
jgi:signal transduction histidine kinase